MAGIRLPISELQTAIYDRIKLDQPTYSVFTAIPGINQAFPYVVINSFQGMPNEFKGGWAWKVAADIEVFSQRRGTNEVNEMATAVLFSISRKSLTLTNNFEQYSFEFNSYSCTSAVTFGDERGPFQQGSLRITIGIEDLAGDPR